MPLRIESQLTRESLQSQSRVLQDQLKVTLDRIVALDTKTTSADPMTAVLCGVSLAVTDNEACYVPIGHRDGDTQGGKDLFALQGTLDRAREADHELADDRAVVDEAPAQVAVDRIGPYYEPVLYQRNGGRDNVAMLGGEPRGYDVPHQLVEHVYRDTGVRTNPLRGIAFLANKFATETFIDEIAGKRGIDPLAFRLELLKSTPRAYKAVERVAQMADWGKKRDGRALGFAFIDYSGSQVAISRSQS